MQETIRPAAIVVGEGAGTVVATALWVAFLLFSPEHPTYQDIHPAAIRQRRRHSFPRLSKI